MIKRSRNGNGLGEGMASSLRTPSEQTHAIGKKSAQCRTQKTKTFTGCWTCRRRKVKCDTTRPYCQRCCKSGLRCEGYDIELCWVTGSETVPPSAIKRNAMRQQVSAPLVFPLDKVDQMLVDLDLLNAPVITSETLSLGPFSVFQSQTYSPEEVSVEPCAGQPASLLEYSSSPENTGTPAPRDVELPLPLLSLRVRSSVYRDPLAGMLMDNYVHNVADLLQPIFHPRNPYSSIYVPAAMRGSVDLLLGVGSTVAAPPSYVAIFYSLLAASVFHLRGSMGRGTQLDELGMKFRTKAFQYVRKALQESSARVQTLERPYPDAALAAILTLVTTDVMEGRMVEYWIHLDGCDQLQRQRNIGESSRQLKTISSFLVTLSNTTVYDLPDLPWPEDQCLSDLHNMLPANEDSSLEFNYGITSTLASMMHLTTKLSQYVSYYTSHHRPLPHTLETACRILGKHISEWSISSEPLSSINSSDLVTLSVAKLHILAFAHALSVYYHTRILRCEPHTMAFYVNAVAEDLQSIEVFRRSQGYRRPVSASIMWPGFIAACEAMPSQRRVWQAWWGDMLTYRIGNIAHLWQVVQDVWAARDAGDVETPGYIGVLRRQKKRVLAV
ncbi:fungal-specific transcription factor domain-containing protein [Lipomyces kononenkoae]